MHPVLHRTLLWDNSIPRRLRQTCRQTEALNPEFEVRWWRNADVRALLEEHDPGHLRVYDGYERDIQRADFARYAILYYCGGLYLDLDIEAVAPFYPLLAELRNHSCILCEETQLAPEFRKMTATYPIRQCLPEAERPECTLRISNFFLAARKGDATMKRILDLCVARSRHTVREDYDVIFTTGPDVVSTVVESRRDQGACILSLAAFDRVFRHHSDGSWRTDRARRSS